MRAVAERDMAVRLAVATKLVRLLEHILVAIAGRVAQHQPVAFCNLAAAKLGVSRGRAHEMLDRGHPADRFVDQARNQFGIGLHLFELRGVLRQRPDRAGGRGRRGVVAGGGDDHVIAGRVMIRHVRAADLCVRNDGGEIVARVAAPVLGNAAEIGAEIRHHRLHHGGELLRGDLLPDPRRVGVLRTEQLLRQLEHARLVLLGHAENFHDDVQGVAESDVFDEIAGAALVEHALHGGTRNLAYPRLELSEIGRHEPALRQRPVFRMIGGIHLHQ